MLSSFIRKSNINSRIICSFRYISSGKLSGNNNNNNNNNNNDNNDVVSHNVRNIFNNKTNILLAKTAISFVAVPALAGFACGSYYFASRVVKMINYEGFNPYDISDYTMSFLGLSITSLGICFIGGHYYYICKYM